MKEGWKKNDEWRMKDDEGWRLNDEGWWFLAVEGFWFMADERTNERTNERTDICNCRVAFVTEKGWFKCQYKNRKHYLILNKMSFSLWLFLEVAKFYTYSNFVNQLVGYLHYM